MKISLALAIAAGAALVAGSALAQSSSEQPMSQSSTAPMSSAPMSSAPMSSAPMSGSMSSDGSTHSMDSMNHQMGEKPMKGDKKKPAKPHADMSHPG